MATSISTSNKRQLILQKATAELGYKENPPNSNKTKYGEWYGWNGFAWCAMFVSWVYDQAQCPLGKIDDMKGFRSCRSGYSFWKRNKQLTRDPQPGDIVLYDWNGDGNADHTGIFEKWITQGKTFYAIEGNTSVGNDSNGGAVMRRQRNVQSVQGFACPAVLGDTLSIPDADLSKGDKGARVTAVQKLLYDLGYTIVVDGDFGKQTEAVVQQFQKDYQLTADGIVTDSLIALMQDALEWNRIPAGQFTNGSYLKKGDSGAAVVVLQKALNKKGRDIAISEDGVMGAETVAALKKFQKDNNLTVDGIAGPQTFAALNIRLI